jgi:glucose-1-phosphate adenylyltransferase
MSKLIIMAAGMSSRMKKAATDSSLDDDLIKQADTLPKGMIGVGEGGRPFLYYLMYNASQAGIKDILLILNPKDTVTQSYFEGNEPFGLTIRYTRQYIPADRLKPLGTADAVWQAFMQTPDWQNSTVIVCNSDNLYSTESIKNLLDCPTPNALPAYQPAALGVAEERIRDFAVLKTNEEGYLQEIVEKPSVEEMEILKKLLGDSLGVSMNIFKLYAPDILPYLANEPLHPTRNEKELPSAVSRMSAENPNICSVLPLSEYLPDITSKADILTIKNYLSQKF